MANSSDLVRQLKAIVGDEYVVHLPEDLLVFERDGSPENEVPRLVVLPDTTAQVSQVMRLAHENAIPVVPRGAGTGLSGGAVPQSASILMPLSRMRRVLGVDVTNRTAVVEPGVVNLDLSHYTEKYGLHYVPDPSSQKACTIGGNVGENAGGPHCLAYGVTTNHVLGLELVLVDGTIVEVGGEVRESPGYDLTGMVVGSEGTLAVATKITVRLTPLPEAVKTFLAVYDEMDTACSAVTMLIGKGLVPAALEMLDNLTIQAVEPYVHAGYPLDAGAVLLVELDGMDEAVKVESDLVATLLAESGAREVRRAETEEERQLLWAGRKGAFGAFGRLAPNYYLLDGVVPRTRLVEALRYATDLCAERGLGLANVFHAGDGNLHPIILFDERQPGKLELAMRAGGDILKKCVELGGVLSGEHGVGLEKLAYMPLMFTPEDMEAMLKVRGAFGNDGLLNPDKVFPKEGEVAEYIPQSAAVLNAGTGSYI